MKVSTNPNMPVFDCPMRARIPKESNLNYCNALGLPIIISYSSTAEVLNTQGLTGHHESQESEDWFKSYFIPQLQTAMYIFPTVLWSMSQTWLTNMLWLVWHCPEHMGEMSLWKLHYVKPFICSLSLSIKIYTWPIRTCQIFLKSLFFYVCDLNCNFDTLNTNNCIVHRMELLYEIKVIVQHLNWCNSKDAWIYDSASRYPVNLCILPNIWHLCCH